MRGWIASACITLLLAGCVDGTGDEDDGADVQEGPSQGPGVWTNGTYDLTFSGVSYDSTTASHEGRCLTLSMDEHDDPIELHAANLTLTWNDAEQSSETLRLRMVSGFGEESVDESTSFSESPLRHEFGAAKVQARGSHWAYLDFCIDAPDRATVVNQEVHVEASFLTKTPVNVNICCIY